MSTHTHTHTHTLFLKKYSFSLKSVYSNSSCMGNKAHILEFLFFYVEFSMEKLSQEHNVLCLWWIADSTLKGKVFLSKSCKIELF